MAEQRQLEEFVNANFDLLSPSDDLNEIYLEEEVTQEELEAVQAVIVQAEGENNSVNDNSLDDFENTSTHQHHASANAEKLDFYAEQIHRDSMKKQTKWAVNLFTSKCSLSSQII